MRLVVPQKPQHPLWGRVLVVYAASRALTTSLMLGLFWLATDRGWSFASYRADPSFFTFSGSWDSSFYRTIALTGYPTELPVDAAGHVEPNAWAFLPVFPAVVRAVMSLGLDFYSAGVLVATLCGAGAAIMLANLLRPRVGDGPALWAAIFFCFGPVSFVLQVAYAESLYLLLLFAALWAMLQRRFLLMLPFALVAAFTRPGILALALALGVVFVVRWARRKTDRFSWPERFRLAATGLLISAAGLAWPVIADHVTGHPDAYLQTELSWWTGFVGQVDFVPLTPWFLMASTYLGVAGIALVLALAAGFAWWLSRRSARELGLELGSYAASYGLYLLAVFLPQQSLFRLALPLAPLLGDPAFTLTRRRRRVLLAIGIALQPVALVLLWFIGYP